MQQLDHRRLVRRVTGRQQNAAPRPAVVMDCSGCDGEACTRQVGRAGFSGLKACNCDVVRWEATPGAPWARAGPRCGVATSGPGQRTLPC